MNKYKYVKVLQGYYGYGWDDLHNFGDSSTIQERKQLLKIYRVNEKNVVHRIINRRELNNISG